MPTDLMMKKMLCSEDRDNTVGLDLNLPLLFKDATLTEALGDNKEAIEKKLLAVDKYFKKYPSHTGTMGNVEGLTPESFVGHLAEEEHIIGKGDSAWGPWVVGHRVNRLRTQAWGLPMPGIGQVLVALQHNVCVQLIDLRKTNEKGIPGQCVNTHLDSPNGIAYMTQHPQDVFLIEKGCLASEVRPARFSHCAKLPTHKRSLDLNMSAK